MVRPHRPALAAEFPNDNPGLHLGAVWVCSSPVAPARAVVRAGRGAIHVVETPVPSAVHVVETPPPSAIHVVETPAPSPVHIVETPPPSAVRGVDEAPAVVAPVPIQPMPILAILAVPCDALAELADGGLAPWGSDAGLASPTETSGEPEVANDAPVADLCDDDDSVDSGDAGDGYLRWVDAVVETALGLGATRAAAVARQVLLLDDGAALPDEGTEGLVAAGLAVKDGSRVRLAADARGVASAWRALLRGETDDFAACGDDTLDGWTTSVLTALLGECAPGDVVRRELRARGVAAFGMLHAAA